MADEKADKSADWGDATEAVYVSALASLDELKSYSERALVVMNWVKYIALHEANRRSPEDTEKFDRIFSFLCMDFARQARDMPESLIEQMQKHGGCGVCSSCRERGIERPGIFDPDATEGELKLVVIEMPPLNDRKSAAEALIETILGKRPTPPPESAN